MSDDTTAPRTPGATDRTAGRVTLINCFAVPDGRDEAFQRLWTETSTYLRAQPGFVSLQLHRAVSADARFRWVNVAVWDSEEHFRRSHVSEGFRRLVAQEA